MQDIISGDRVMLAKAISLAESTLAADIRKTERILGQLGGVNRPSVRIGITGAPGVGKSTFIEAFGKYLTSTGKKIAVLAIDPSSRKTKGSILGDKTRMDELSRDPDAFIRPSPSGNSHGGVNTATQQSILLCEAAGFDVILVETVGVGQSETDVRGMVDFFLLLMLAGAGDELQGIKKGIMEMADGVVITKADGENVKRARSAQADFQHALHWFRAPESGWTPKVLTCSAVERSGIEAVWKMIGDFEAMTRANGFFDKQRKEQNVGLFHRCVEELLKRKRTASSRKRWARLEQKVRLGSLSPVQAARMFISR